MVSLLEHTLSSISRLTISRVLAELSIGVGLGASEESFLGGFEVAFLSLPGLEDGVLESACIGERHVPGVGALVHGVEVEGRLELGLSTRQEHDTGDGRGHTAAEHLQGVVSDLFRTGTALALGTGGDHGRLQEDTLEEDTVVSQVLESLGPGHFGDFESAVDIVLTVQEDLGLNDGDETGVLSNGGVAGEAVSAVTDGDGGGTGGDGDDGAPLGETSALLVVLGATLGEAVETGAPGLSVGVGEGVESLVDLDTGDDAVIVEAVDHGSATTSVLEEGLLEKDGTRDELAETGGGNEELTVSLTVLDGVFEADRFQALTAGSVGLVHGQDALTRGCDLLLQSEIGRGERKMRLDGVKCCV